MPFPGAAILKFKMAAINGIFYLAIHLKMLRTALSSIVPNFMLLSKSAQLFHIICPAILGPLKSTWLFHYVHKKYARFQKDPLKTVGDVNYTNSLP